MIRGGWVLLAAGAMVAGAAHPARALTLQSFGPQSWQAPDAALGFTNPVVEDFEQTALVAGLSYAVTLPNVASLPSPVTSLPNTFDPRSDPNGSAFALGAWDGTHALIDTTDNQSHPYSASASWGSVSFDLAAGATRVGFSLTDMERANTLTVDGVPLGTIGTLAGTTALELGPSIRNGYLVVVAGPGELIYSVTIDNNGSGDGWAIDHLLIEGAPPATAALFVTDDLANAVYRYLIAPGAQPRLDATISASGANAAALRSTGELFVGDYAGDGIHRFLAPFGAAIPRAEIVGVGLSISEQLRFVDDELWVVNSDLAGTTNPSTIVRLAFDGQGNASVAGTLTDGLVGADRGMLWNAATRDLYVSQCCSASAIQHYRVGSGGAVTRLQAFTGNGLANPHGMAILPWGELVVANADANQLLRFVLDGQGNGTLNSDGLIEGNGLSMAIGVALAPWGELYVVSSDDNTVSRFSFDTAHFAHPNGSFTTPSPAGSRPAWAEIVDLPVGCAPPTLPSCVTAGHADAGADATGDGPLDAATADGNGDAPTGADGGADREGGGSASGCGCRLGEAPDGPVPVALTLVGLALAGLSRPPSGRRARLTCSR